MDAALRTIRDLDEQRPDLRLYGREPPATATEIEDAEQRLGVRLPDELKQLWAEVGAGTIGYAWVYSYRPDADNPIFDVNGSELQPRRDFVAFSDNGTGDYYGWRVESGACVGPVLFSDHETGESASHAGSLAEWLEKHVRLT